MFYLKSKKKSKSPIVLKYYIKGIGKYFEYSTGQSIEPDLWDIKNNRPKKKRGVQYDYLTNITHHLNRLELTFNEYISNQEFNNLSFDTPAAKRHLDTIFKRNISSLKTHLLDFLNTFIEEAPDRVNRNTKRKYSVNSIRELKSLYKNIDLFQNAKRKKIPLGNVTQRVYDELFLFWEDKLGFSKNYIGKLVKNLIHTLKIAEKEYGYTISQDYKEKEFAVVVVSTTSIALTEDEIDLLFNYDFTDNPLYENCRDWFIIGVWTGLRVSDFLELDLDPDDKYIHVTPKKTSKFDIKTVIPLHKHIKHILLTRGMPEKTRDYTINTHIKSVCEIVGIDNVVKGSLMNPNTRRKETGMFPKFKLVSSHTCRRSFATNMYLMNFPTLSIMQITGHTTEQSFLKYIKVTPKEHAEKLLAHWEEYYANKK